VQRGRERTRDEREKASENSLTLTNRQSLVYVDLDLFKKK